MSELPKTVDLAAKALCGHEFDAIAFRGMSGALIAPLLAQKLNKTIILVRKPGEGSHSYQEVEGDYGAKKYVIVDDFIDSGKTVLAIQDALKLFIPDAECIGTLEVNYLREETVRTMSPLAFVKELGVIDRVLNDRGRYDHFALAQRERDPIKRKRLREDARRAEVEKMKQDNARYQEQMNAYKACGKIATDLVAKLDGGIPPTPTQEVVKVNKSRSLQRDTDMLISLSRNFPKLYGGWPERGMRVNYAR